MATFADVGVRERTVCRVVGRSCHFVLENDWRAKDRHFKAELPEDFPYY